MRKAQKSIRPLNLTTNILDSKIYNWPYHQHCFELFRYDRTLTWHPEVMVYCSFRTIYLLYELGYYTVSVIISVADPVLGKIIACKFVFAFHLLTFSLSLYRGVQKEFPLFKWPLYSRQWMKSVNFCIIDNQITKYMKIYEK
jgi:hypothetical protein